MKHGPASVDEAIRIEAYILSEKAGHPSGMERAFWQQAETIVHSRLSAGIIKPARARKQAATRPAASRSKPVAAKPKATVAARKSSPEAKAAFTQPAPVAKGKAPPKAAPKLQPAKRPPIPRKAKS